MKRLVSFFLFLFLFFFFSFPISAQSEFRTTVSVDYLVNENGTTTVTHRVALENLFSNLYATSYTLNLEGIKPINPQAFQGKQELKLETQTNEGIVSLKVNFTEPVVGKGARRDFRIVFQDNSLVTKTGEVWEISIPKLVSSDSFDSYTVNLSVPRSFGQPAFISPDPVDQSTVGVNQIFVFNKRSLGQNPVMAAFGNFQVFSFDLVYHLENPLNKPAYLDIAVPPDTAFQKVIYQQIKPEPEGISLDQDGNWLAKYKLKPRERIDVQVKGSVQIFSQPHPVPTPSAESLTSNLSPSEFWQTDDSQIQALAKRLKTPKAIYNYVVSTLKYDYTRVKPNLVRLGARAALDSPESAICMEFTDLFITLSRAAGIPAREINGYAYTENPELQPLSLVADVLHSWPEYWDNQKEVWTPIDPTWASSTGGIDFFSKFDLRHFAFVIHGQDPNKPYPPGSYKLGPNPQKDIHIAFGELPQTRTSTPQISLEKERSLNPLQLSYRVRIDNPGPSALYNLNLEVLFDHQPEKTETVEILLPYSQEEVEVKVPATLFANQTPNTITVQIEDQQAEISTNKELMIVVSLITVSIVILILILSILIRIKKIKLPKIKIKNPFKKRKLPSQKEIDQFDNS